MTNGREHFEGVKPNPYYLRRSEWVKAVKISARNEMKIGGVKKYRVMEIPQDHFIFSRDLFDSKAHEVWASFGKEWTDGLPWSDE